MKQTSFLTGHKSMKNLEIAKLPKPNRTGDAGQRGTAIVIALFVLALLSVFVAFAVSRTTAETAAIGNETSEARVQYATQGCLETMTREFNKVFETRLNPLPSDLIALQDGSQIPLSRQTGGDYDFNPQPLQSSTPYTLTLNTGPYAGLFAIRDSFRLRCTGTSWRDETQIQLTRNVLNNRIPIFQFGIFYNDDLELFRPPRFSFGGRVHSNGNFFISPGSEGVYFDSRVTAVGHIVTQSWRNWNQSDINNNETWIKNGSGAFVQLLPTRGSVLNTTSGNANNVFEFPPAIPTPVPTPNADLPPSRLNPNWATQSAVFDGNLLAQVPQLRLPLNVGQGTDLIEMVKRGKDLTNVLSVPQGQDLFMNNVGDLAPVTNAAGEMDNPILRSERFANKTGIRISLADSKAKLPGCASGVGTTPIAGRCGVRLDGDAAGQTEGAVAGARGYQPKAMRLNPVDNFNYRATRVNGDRLFNTGREVWIKVETVRTDAVTGLIVNVDITEDILSLGMTEAAPGDIPITWPANYTNVPFGVLTRANNGTATAPSANLTATAAQTASTYPDSRSVIKIQHFAIGGPTITSTTPLLSSFNVAGNDYNVVRRYTTATGVNLATAIPCNAGCTLDDRFPDAVANDEKMHLKQANLPGAGGADSAIVPFPIQMFDSREGTYFDDATRYTAGRVTRNGVMSMVNVDLANLRRFLRGDFNGLFPNGVAPNDTLASQTFARAMLNTDIPENGGWVLYVSDRRGDGNFDGEYDMEDVYGNAPGNDGILQPGEDLDGPIGPNQRFGAGVLDRRYIDPGSATNGCLGGVLTCEASRYADVYLPDRAAVTDHPYFRRGIRLMNGTVLPGVYDSVTASNTRGFTVASENGIYVKGNYNATGASAPPAQGNTPFNQYFPVNTATHIPASIVADAVTILSNGWNDAQSFTSPYNRANRVATATQMRFALITGDTISTRQNAVNQGSSVNGQNENGGVHNFKRFLEIWTNVRLDYSGSLINLFNSRNNNGSFKCCNTVYNPPIRNWVFDSTFLDPARIPPGTPFFQYVQTTGFERTTE